MAATRRLSATAGAVILAGLALLSSTAATAGSKGAMVVESTYTGRDGRVTTGTLTYTRRRGRP